MKGDKIELQENDIITFKCGCKAIIKGKKIYSVETDYFIMDLDEIKDDFTNKSNIAAFNIVKIERPIYIKKEDKENDI